MNYVLFFPDELRAETLSCYGNKNINTPHFDRLAKEGVLFEQCHVQNPVCSPSRISLMTGQYVHTNGHRTLWNLIKPQEHNLMRYLKDAGYEVRIYGKNDVFAQETIPQSAHEFRSCPSKTQEKPSPVNGYGYDFLFEPTQGDPTEHSDYQNLLAGMEFIRNRKQGDKPFILFLPLLMPHCPYTIQEPYYSMYGEGEVPALRPIGNNKPAFHEMIRRYRKLENANLNKIQAVYMGMTTFVDSLLGALMDCIDDAGIRDETMLIASADHGDYAGDYGLVEKWPSGCEDVLTRVPLLVRSPGCKAGHRVGEQVALFDIMATILEAAEVTAKHTHYARSFLPQLRGERGDPGRAVFCEGGYNPNEPHCNEGMLKPSTTFMNSPEFIYYPKGLQQKECPESVGRATMIRTLQYKLIRRSFGGHELYDLQADPLELNNLYSEPGYAPIRLELEQNLLQWYLDTSDAVPTEEDPRGVTAGSFH